MSFLSYLSTQKPNHLTCNVCKEVIDELGNKTPYRTNVREDYVKIDNDMYMLKKPSKIISFLKRSKYKILTYSSLSFALTIALYALIRFFPDTMLRAGKSLLVVCIGLIVLFIPTVGSFMLGCLVLNSNKIEQRDSGGLIWFVGLFVILLMIGIPYLAYWLGSIVIALGSNL